MGAREDAKTIWRETGRVVKSFVKNMKMYKSNPLHSFPT